MYTQVSHGMQSRMMFEMEESGVRRYTGTITSTSDLDPVHWKNSQWRNIQVQKRGSVGRTIDVTRYKGYDELQHDLAHMFGIKWLLEDPQRIEWKLVFVDHEYDILHVGDDPWD